MRHRWLVVTVLGASVLACGDWRAKPRQALGQSAVPGGLAPAFALDPGAATPAAATVPSGTASASSGQIAPVLVAAPAEGLRSADDVCVENALHSLVLHAKGDTVVVDGSLDVSACLAASLRSPGTQVLTANEELRFYLMISCDSIDLSALDGKTYGDMLAAGSFPCQAAQGARIASKTEDLQSARLSRMTPAGSVVVAEEGRRVLHAVIGAQGDPCRYLMQEGHLAREACTDVNRVKITRSRLESGNQITINPDEGKEDDQRTQDGPLGTVSLPHW